MPGFLSFRELAMSVRTAVVAGAQALARGTPIFPGKFRLFRALYRACGVPADQEFHLRMRGTSTPVHVRLASLLESRVLCLGDYEPAASRVIEQVVRPGWNCLDLGANVGLIAVRLAERVGPTGRVVAVEPNAELMPRLTANTAALANVVRLEVAVGDEPGDGYLAVNDPNTCANHNATMVAADPAAGAVPVQVTTIDRIWAEHLQQAPVGFVKLDIEGYEFKALRGGRQLIAASRPAILMELNRPYARQMGYTFESVLAYLRELAPYRAYECGASGRGRELTAPAGELFDVLFQVG